MSGVPVRTSPLHHSPPRLGESQIPLAFPKTSRPRQSRGAMDNQVRLQAWLGSSAGCGSFWGEVRIHTRSTRSFLSPHPAPRTPHPFPARGADGAPAGGGFPPGWGWSSHMQPLQTQTALLGLSKRVCLSGRNSAAAGVLDFQQNNVRLGV